MFGGWSLYTDGLTFAIIADVGGGEKLWLKADDEVRHRFEAAGCERFAFQGKEKVMSMGYYTAPEEAMDSQEAMRPWARLALECALRARAAKPKPKAAAKPATPRPAKSAAPRKSRTA